MLNIFRSYTAKTSLLDDFDFYERREKLFRSQRSTKHKHARPEQEVYGNDNYQVRSIVYNNPYLFLQLERRRYVICHKYTQLEYCNARMLY